MRECRLVFELLAVNEEQGVWSELEASMYKMKTDGTELE